MATPVTAKPVRRSRGIIPELKPPRGTHRERDDSTVIVRKSPIAFEEFLDMFQGHYVELVNGVVEVMPMVQLDHELLTGWLYALFKIYVEERKLGIVLSSRIAVKISEFGSRLPDLFFVPNERIEIVQQR